MARLAMSTELSAWVAERIAEFPYEASESLQWLVPSVAEYVGLPLYVGWWDVVAIKADGEIIGWSTDDEFSGFSGVRSIDDRYYWLCSLISDSQRYEPLKSLILSRPTHAIDCRHLDLPIFGEGGVVCPECCGLGWIDPTGA